MNPGLVIGALITVTGTLGGAAIAAYVTLRQLRAQMAETRAAREQAGDDADEDRSLAQIKLAQELLTTEVERQGREIGTLRTELGTETEARKTAETAATTAKNEVGRLSARVTQLENTMRAEGMTVPPPLTSS